MASYSVDYEPTAKQMLFHATKADEVLYGGAAGGGKSKACVMDAFAKCMMHPGTNAYLFRRSYPELRDTLITEALRSLPQGLYRYKSADHDMLFPNGSAMRFRHCLNDRDMLLYQGAEIHWLYIDELTHFSKAVYDYLKTRLRANVSLAIKPLVRCTSNPGGPGHGWVKSYFVDSAPFGEVHETVITSEITKKSKTVTLQYIPARATDNPHITEDYIYQLEQKPKALREALLYGKWDAFEGQAFPEWVDDPAHYQDGIGTHVIMPFEIPDWWPRYRSFDHGYSKPFSVGWWASDPQGRLYRYREWYGCEKGNPNTGICLTVNGIADGIVEREREERARGIHFLGICDPALTDKSRGANGESIVDLMTAKGVYFAKGDNTRLAGKAQIHNRLKFKPDGKPMLQVFNCCEDFRRTFPVLCYDQIKVEDIDTDGEDHIYDETRYMCMRLPIKAEQPPDKARPWAFDPLED